MFESYHSALPCCLKAGPPCRYCWLARTVALANAWHCHSQHHRVSPTDCSDKENFTGAQSYPFAYVLFMAAFMLPIGLPDLANKNTWCPAFYLTALTIRAKLNSWDRNHMAHKIKNTSHLALRSRGLPTPALCERHSPEPCGAQATQLYTGGTVAGPGPLGNCTSF